MCGERVASLRVGASEAGTNWVFASEIGEPINPRTDWAHWKKLLSDADIRDGWLHDARHPAATVLLLLDVSRPAMMSIMVWSNPAMTQRYAHVIAASAMRSPNRLVICCGKAPAVADPSEGDPEGLIRRQVLDQ